MASTWTCECSLNLLLLSSYINAVQHCILFGFRFARRHSAWAFSLSWIVPRTPKSISSFALTSFPSRPKWTLSYSGHCRNRRTVHSICWWKAIGSREEQNQFPLIFHRTISWRNRSVPICVIWLVLCQRGMFYFRLISKYFVHVLAYNVLNQWLVSQHTFAVTLIEFWLCVYW